MIVSAKGRYALRILAALAERGGSAALKEIAETEGIPRKYAEAIMNTLVKAGFAEGTRGKNGGYRLTRAPAEYTLAEILQTTETSLVASECSESAEACPRASSCPTLPVWRALDETIRDFFSRYTLADLMRTDAETASTLP